MTTPEKKLPDGWQWVKLGDVCKFEYGASLPSRNRIPGAYKVFGANGQIGTHVKPLTSGPTIIIGRKGSAGEVNYISEPCWPIDTAYYVEEHLTSANLEWLYIALKTLQLGKLDKSTAIPGLNRNDVYDMSIPLPPLAEQQRIVTELEAQMAVVERAKKAAEEILEAVKTLTENLPRKFLPLGQKLPHSWQWARLGDVCEKIEIDNPKSRPDTLFMYVDISSINRNTKTIVSPSLIVGKDAPSRARRIIRKGDVLVSTTRPNLNAVALVSSGLDGEICSTGLCVLRPNREMVDSGYLYYYTTQETFVASLSAIVSGAMYPAVTDKQVFDQTIPLPPLSEQRRIVAALEAHRAAADRAKQAADDALNGLRELPGALLRRAFAGEV